MIGAVMGAAEDEFMETIRIIRDENIVSTKLNQVKN